MTTLETLKPNKAAVKHSRKSRRKTGQLIEFSHYAPKPEWANRFEEISGQALEKYLAGHRGADGLVTQEQQAFLASLGTSPQEIYDYVEDWCEYGVPSFETALRMTEVRAEYFLQEQQGQLSTEVVTPDALPSRNAELGGFVWLPRIIAKAQAKLRGEMSPEIMYGCAGDRAFLTRVGIDPARFLQIVRSAGPDSKHIVNYVKISAEFQADSSLNFS